MHRLTNGQVARSKVRSGKSLVLISTWAADLQISTADSVQRGISSRKKIVDIRLNLITFFYLDSGSSRTCRSRSQIPWNVEFRREKTVNIKLNCKTIFFLFFSTGATTAADLQILTADSVRPDDWMLAWEILEGRSHNYSCFTLLFLFINYIFNLI